MISKITLMIMIFAGILLITINIVKSEQKCPKQQIIYRYIPRTFEEEQDDPVYVSDIFKTMFSQQSPWVYSVSNIDRKKEETMMNYFVSQY